MKEETRKKIQSVYRDISFEKVHLMADVDPAAVRQVAMVDAEGNVAVHTGKRAIAAAGHQAGAPYSVQANLMDQGSVWPAMANAYENAEGDLAERLLVALEAAEAEGGDLRGRQSAAILVVSAEDTGRPWVDRVFDLRVEDHPEPVGELRRLVRLARAYHKLDEGDGLVTAGDMEAAMDAYRAATEVVPDEATGGEAPFWVGVTLASEGREKEAVPYLQRAQVQNDRWAELLRRLPASGLMPADDELMDRLAAAMIGE